MTGLDYFSFLVLAVLIAAGIWLAVVLGELPGRVAAQRGNPQADAIRVAGWLGLLSLGLLWPFALIWAYMKTSAGEEIASLRAEVARLEEALDARAAGSASGADS